MKGDQDASLTYLNEAWAVDETGAQGLGQALLTFYAMSLAGLDSATVWTALSYGGGGYQTTSAFYVETRDRIQPVGVLYEQMATHLKGSHRPTRKREKIQGRFKSARQAQRFLCAHDEAANLFHPRRHKMTASRYRQSLAAAFERWNDCAKSIAA